MPATGTMTQRQPRIIHVHIDCAPGTTPTVDVESGRISRGIGDELRWECADDPNWKVDFGASSPFARQTFDQANDHSGRALPTAQLKYYKYSVTACGGTADPGVIVDR